VGRRRPDAGAMRGASPGRPLGGDEDEMGADPIVKALERSTIAKTLKAARASLAEPSRPYTPLDRSLFQLADASGGSRPNSGYTVDQLAFVRDTYGNRPDSARSSRSRLAGTWQDPIAEEEEAAYRREGAADVLRLEEDDRGSLRTRPSPQDSEAGDFSSDSEELTPVMASGMGGDAPAPAARPPRPPGSGGYPPAPRSSGGYPPDPAATVAAGSLADRSPKRRASDASPRRRRVIDASPQRQKEFVSSSTSLAAGLGRQPAHASASPSPSTSHRRRSSSKSRGDDWATSCDAVVAKLRALADDDEKGKVDSQALTQVSERVLELIMDIRNGKAGSKSSAPALLRAVLGLLDLKDTTCLFRLSRCALALLQEESAIQGVHSSGVQAAYLNIAKVLFKCSKAEGHDADFLNEGLLVSLLEVLQSDSPDCCSEDLRVYVVGVLKNVSLDERNTKMLIHSGAIPVLFKLTKAEQLTGGSKEAQLLIQITATLRSLAGHGYKQFLTEENLNGLTRMMALFPANVELLTNISRTLAKLTLHGSACEAYVKTDVHIRQIAKTMSAHADVAPLTLRLAFVLGNLTARSDKPRVAFAFACEGTSLAPQLLAKYWQKERQLARIELEKGRAKASGLQEIDEVLVKVVRLIANMAISASAGTTLASSSAVVDPLLDMLGAKRISESEELVLNVVAAVTNLLFYDVPSNLLFQEDNKQLLCRLFRPLLLESYNVEALVETARALGNLSRHADARQCMTEIRLDEILAILLDHDDRNLVFYVCGALVNLAADHVCTGRLTTVCPVVQKLGQLLDDCPPDDVPLQLVAVKVLTNLSLDPGAVWPAGIHDVREALERLIEAIGVAPTGASPAEGADEGHQLLELSQFLLGRLPPALDDLGTDGGVGATSQLPVGAGGVGGRSGRAAAEKFICQAPGCGRKFSSEAKLAAHEDRRHPELRPSAVAAMAG